MEQWETPWETQWETKGRQSQIHVGTRSHRALGDAVADKVGDKTWSTSWQDPTEQWEFQFSNTILTKYTSKCDQRPKAPLKWPAVSPREKAHVAPPQFILKSKKRGKHGKTLYIFVAIIVLRGGHDSLGAIGGFEWDSWELTGPLLWKSKNKIRFSPGRFKFPANKFLVHESTKACHKTGPLLWTFPT